MNVERESLRDPARRQSPLPLSLVAPAAETDEGALDRQQTCAASCLATLAATDLALLRRYHDGEGRDGIHGRVRLAEELGVGVNALRIRAFRLRQQMQACLAKCLAKSIRDSDR